MPSFDTAPRLHNTALATPSSAASTTFAVR